MKKQVIFILLLSLLLVSSCQYLPFGKQKEESGRGVKIGLTDFPTGTLYEDEPFVIGVTVTNSNPDPLSGQVCVNDFVSKRLEGIPEGTCEAITLEPAEEIEEVVYPKQWQNSFGPFYYRNIEAGVPYSTNLAGIFTYILESRHFIPSFCVKTNEEITTPISCEKAETISSLRQPETPLHVTSVEKSVSSLGGNKVNVRLNIILRQNEEGDLVSRESVDQPVSGNPLVDFSVEYLGIPFSCSGLKDNRLEFNQDTKQVSCRAEVDVPQGYVSEPLEIKLGYGFRKIVQTESIRLIAKEDEQSAIV